MKTSCHICEDEFDSYAEWEKHLTTHFDVEALKRLKFQVQGDNGKFKIVTENHYNYHKAVNYADILNRIGLYFSTLK